MPMNKNKVAEKLAQSKELMKGVKLTKQKKDDKK